MVGAVSTQILSGEIPSVAELDERSIQSSSPRSQEVIDSVAQEVLKNASPSQDELQIKGCVTHIQILDEKKAEDCSEGPHGFAVKRPRSPDEQSDEEAPQVKRAKIALTDSSDKQVRIVARAEDQIVAGTEGQKKDLRDLENLIKMVSELSKNPPGTLIQWKEKVLEAPKLVCEIISRRVNPFQKLGLLGYRTGMIPGGGLPAYINDAKSHEDLAKRVQWHIDWLDKQKHKDEVDRKIAKAVSDTLTELINVINPLKDINPVKK